MKKIKKLILSLVAAFSVVSMIPQSLVVFEVRAEEGTNVSLKGSAYAGTTEITAGDKTYLNDGVLTTIWTSENATDYAGVKLDTQYSVNKIRVVFKDYGVETSKLMKFTVSYYDTVNGKYVNLTSGVSYDENNDDSIFGHKYYWEHTFTTPVVANEVKVTITENFTGEAAKVGEIQTFGSKYDPSKVPTNLAFGKAITATKVDYGRVPANAVDGKKNNVFWDGGTITSSNIPSVTIDLGEECLITEMKATAYVDGSRYYFYYVEVSTDGTTWTKVADREQTHGTKPAFVDETYTFATPVEAKYIRVTVTKNSANSVAHLVEFEAWGYPKVTYDNIALNKTVSASNSDNGSNPDVITDGITTGNFWDGGPASASEPVSFTIDLEGGYFINKMKAYPYVDGRRYEYFIETSIDGVVWTKVADRVETHGTVAAFNGETYNFDDINARFVRVSMTKNTANPSVHMREFEVYGYADPDYKAPTSDPVDSKNLAFGKEVRSHLNTKSIVNVVDGLDATYCTGAFAPAYFDIDLEENIDLEEVILKVPAKTDRYYYFTIYGSTDGENYDRLYRGRSKETNKSEYVVDLSGHTYRIVRVYIEYVSDTNASLLSEVRIHGDLTGQNTGKLNVKSNDKAIIETILDMTSWEDSEYSATITEQETIENVYGIIDRIIGSQYRDWFTFQLQENTLSDKDYFQVGSDPISGKILITGNDGISLASGLNYYLENYCNVQVSEQTVNGKMPSSIVKVTNAVRKENQVAIRYAFNYCTLNYTFSYADAAEFQREYDWMALNGVNCVLDLAGQEAVWIMFLMNFGYTYEEAKDWIAGPTYYAWQFMDNMEVIGGPVSDEWVAGRLEMARENQRWKLSLGMQTCLQGYAGMIPNNFGEYQDVEILEQGTWCNLPRPDMIRTDGALYDTYADLFYKAQEWAFGDTSDYYAVDPFHEGGIRPSDLTDDAIAANVLESLLKYDKDAVWMVQAWWDNPTNALLNGMGEYREDHVIILDLMGLNSVYNDPYWKLTEYRSTKLDADEFNNTSWVWCMLDNYGGNPGMDGRPKQIVSRLQDAFENAEHMKGIGFISEATYDNPLIYDLVFDMAWVTVEELQAVSTEDFLNKWLDTWVLSRYGVASKEAREAWDILIETVYSSSGSPSQVLLSTNPSLAGYGSGYSFSKLETALEKLFKDYDKLSASASYRYDLTEIMRQIVSNYAAEVRAEMNTAYTNGNVAKFKELKEEFLYAFDLMELVTSTQQDLLIGEWVGSAADWATDTNADDWAYDTMTINAKTLITVWAPTTYLGTYAYRHYNGVISDIYKPVWEAYLNRCVETLETGSATTASVNYTKLCMEWIYTDWADQVQSSSNPDGYIRYADNSVAYMKDVVQEVLDTVIYVAPENVGNICLDKEVETNAERPNSPGAPGGGYAANVNDGIVDTYWDGITWQVEEGKEPYVIIDLEDAYIIDKLNVVNYYVGTRYYLYDVYVSVDGEEWTLVADREEVHGTTPSPAAGDDYIYETDKPIAQYIKLVGLFNSSNEGFHVKEIRAYGTRTADYSKIHELIETANGLDKNNYVDFSKVVEAIEAVEYYLVDQSVVDAYANAIQNALNELVLKDADYTKVNEALALVPEDLSVYTEETVEPLQEAIEAVVEGLDITKQETVDNFAKAIKETLEALELKPADYTIVEEALSLVPEDLSIYTEETVEALQEAIEAVVEGLDITKQETVNAYARAIVDALNELTVKGADYSKVDEAMSKVPTDLTKYTEESAKTLKEALEAVVRGLDVTKQEEVDGYAKAIEDALEELVKVQEGGSADTSDTFNVSFYVFLLLASLYAFTELKKRA